MNGKRLLIVDDDAPFLELHSQMLSRQGYEVRTARNAEEARKILTSSSPDVIVLDIRLPDGNGIELCGEIQSASSSPILFVSGLVEDEDIMAGLDSGGDDYLTKPFEFGVLVSRIEALLRRAARVPETVEKGPLKLDIAANQAFLNGTDMLLTHKEFSLLLLFMQREGRVMSAEHLYEKVWRPTDGGGHSSNQKIHFQVAREIEKQRIHHNFTSRRGLLFWKRGWGTLGRCPVLFVHSVCIRALVLRKHFVMCHASIG